MRARKHATIVSVLRVLGLVVYWLAVIMVSVALLIVLVIFFESRDESGCRPLGCACKGGVGATHPTPRAGRASGGSSRRPIPSTSSRASSTLCAKSSTASPSGKNGCPLGPVRSASSASAAASASLLDGRPQSRGRWRAALRVPRARLSRSARSRSQGRDGHPVCRKRPAVARVLDQAPVRLAPVAALAHRARKPARLPREHDDPLGGAVERVARAQDEPVVTDLRFTDVSVGSTSFVFSTRYTYRP